MTRALDALGPHLLSLPDGEIGDKSAAFPRGNRVAWVMSAVEALTADSACFRVVSEPTRSREDGLATSYTTIQKLVPRLPPAEIARRVSFGYDTYFSRSYPIFRALREARGLPGLTMQVGVPTGFALGFAFASKLDWIRNTGAMSAVIAREVSAIVEAAGDDVVIQIEVPPEVYAANMLPSWLLKVALMPIVDMLDKLSVPTTLGFHLCLGDFRNEALVHPKTLSKLVAFANALPKLVPARHRLAYVHLPLAEGKDPPPLDAGYYAPFRDIVAPEGVRIVAGFVHEGRSLDEHRRILGAIEDARGRAVDVASSCGLGRRSAEVASHLLGVTAKLVDG